MPAVTLHVSGALGEALNATALGDQAPSTADPAAGVAPRLPRRPAPRVPAIKKPTLRRTGKVRPGSVRPSLRSRSMRIASRSGPSPSTPRVPDDGGGARPCGARSAGALCFPPPPRPAPAEQEKQEFVTTLPVRCPRRVPTSRRCGRPASRASADPRLCAVRVVCTWSQVARSCEAPEGPRLLSPLFLQIVFCSRSQASQPCLLLQRHEFVRTVAAQRLAPLEASGSSA